MKQPKPEQAPTSADTRTKSYVSAHPGTGRGVTSQTDQHFTEALSFIADVEWKEASTFRNSPYPHEYVVREWWEGAPDRWNKSKIHPHDPMMLDRFDLFSRALWAYGKMENFIGRGPNAYLYIGGHKYWQLDSVINRTNKPGELFGDQWSSSPSAKPSTRCWDAPTWDQNHNPPAVKLPDLTGRTVLNVGCGTGWLLDEHGIDPSCYVGLDTSVGMLNQHIRKHPHHRVHAQPLSDYLAASHDQWHTAIVNCTLPNEDYLFLSELTQQVLTTIKN